MALCTLLYGCETWTIREQDKSRITSAEKFMRRTAKYTWHDYQPMKAFYQNLKLTQMLRKVKITEINGYNVFGEWTETDRQTDCHT